MSSKLGFVKCHNGHNKLKFRFYKMVFHTMVSQKKSALLYKIKMRIGVVEPHPRY